MTTAHTIFTNTLGQTILRMVEVMLGILTLGIITRYLGQVGFGQYTTVTALLQFFIVLVDLGLYLTLLRELSANPPERAETITNNILTLRLITAAAFLIVALVIISASPYPMVIKVGAAMLSMSFLFASLAATLTALFQKNLQMIRVAGLNVVSRVLLLGSTIFIVMNNMGIHALFAAASIIAALAFAALLYLASTATIPIRFRLTYNAAYWREVILKTWPLALTTALNLVYFKADTIILSLFQSQENVGIYGASYRVLEILATFPHMFMGLILPILTAAWVAHDRALLTAAWQKAFTFFAFLTFPMIAGVQIVGPQLMSLVAGTEFALSGTVLQILIIATAAIFFGTLYTYMVIVVEQQRTIIKYFLVTAIISVIGYLFFIPLYSYWGAAWMTVASEVLIILGAWLVLRKTVRLVIPWGIIARLAIASVLMAFVTWMLQDALPLIPLVFMSAIVYGILTILLKALSWNDIRALVKN